MAREDDTSIPVSQKQKMLVAFTSSSTLTRIKCRG